MYYYCAVTILGLTPAHFWRMTPRKLNALLKAHGEANKVDDKKPNSQTVDNPDALRNSYLNGKGLGPKSYGALGQSVPEPDSFVDNLSFMK